MPKVAQKTFLVDLGYWKMCSNEISKFMLYRNYHQSLSRRKNEDISYSRRRYFYRLESIF
jgi:hypothetical protein